MDRSLEKALEKSKKFKAKGQFEKARASLEAVPAAAQNHVAFAHEAISISLHLDFWQEIINLIGPHLRHFSFEELLGGDNRETFVTLARDNASFATGLLHLITDESSLESAAQWMTLCDSGDQRFHREAWEAEAEKSPDPIKGAHLRARVGVAYFCAGELDAALDQWSHALTVNPRELKPIMGFCQRADRLGDNQLSHRLKLIRLVAAAGKKNESLGLLKALGAENREAAQQVLREMPRLLRKHLKDKDVLSVRFKLALKIADHEIIASIIEDMDHLSEDEFFPFKKLALHQVPDRKLRMTVLLNFVRLYIRQENWENAAPLLQMLYEEENRQEVVDLMEQVLDRFPIISSLRFLLGKHHLNKGNVVNGIQHLSTIAQVPEYDDQIRELLQERLNKGYDTETARLLVRMDNTLSNKAGLVALYMAIKDPRGLLASLSGWGDPHFREQTSPFWALALVYANLSLKRYEQAYPFLCQLLHRFPDMSPEAVRPAERMCAEYQRDYAELVRIIDQVSERLQPRKAWAALRKHFASVSHGVKSGTFPATPQRKPTPAPQPAPEPAASQDETHTGPVANPIARTVPPTGLPPEFHRFKGYLEAGNARAAAEIAEKTVSAYPQSILFVLNQLERLSREQPRQLLWPLTMLRILVNSATFEKAIEVGRRIISTHHFQAEMPKVYQLLARAFEGIEDEQEALRFYCLSSRQARFYEQNRERLLDMVLPGHPEFLREVVQLALNNDDVETWDELMKEWYKHRPEDIDKIIAAQASFTEHVGSPRTVLDLAFWYLQAGRLAEIDETLNRIDLQDPEILDYLTHIAHLAHLKYPEDPKPKFLLGKYYLVQRDVSKAVDTFRNLARQIPEAAETIYHYLRTYLKKNNSDTDLVTLYGLLIRFALDYGSPVAAVRLLDELGSLDREGAAGLVNGVYRVILRKNDRLEAMYELMRLLHSWGDMERLLEVAEQGGFGDHMAAERLEWLANAARDRTQRDRAMLAMAQTYYDTFDFSRCREALRRIEHGTYRRKALSLYERLADRFPEQMDIWREAGWAAFPQEPGKARHFFTKVLTCPHFENKLEAFAVLSEVGAKPDYEELADSLGNEDLVLGELRRIHIRIRDMELAYYESTGQNLPITALEWLIQQKSYSRFQEALATHSEVSDLERTILEARCLLEQGLVQQAAWHLTRQDVPEEMLQSYFHRAGLTEQAVLRKKPGTRLQRFIRESYLRERGKPSVIAANYRDHKQATRQAPVLSEMEG